MQGMPGQMPMQPTTGLVISAAQTAESQRALILKQQQQQGAAPGQSPQMHNSPPRVNGIPQPHGFPMQNMVAFNGNMNGISTPPMNGMASSPGPGHGQASSPRMGQQLPYSQDAQTSVITRMEASLRKQYPNAPNDQIMAMMTEHLKRNAAQQRQGLAQSAMNAAAGSANGMGDANGQMTAASNNPQGSAQAYAQMIARQQQNQQKQEQARQAANALSANPGQNGQENRPPVQGHAHRNSSGSVQSGK
jgi:chromatin modification-related protein VID21